MKKIMLFLLIVWSGASIAQGGYGMLPGFYSEQIKKDTFYRVIKKNVLKRIPVHMDIQVISETNIDTLILEDRRYINLLYMITGGKIDDAIPLVTKDTLGCKWLLTCPIRIKVLRLMDRFAKKPLNGYYKITSSDTNIYALGYFYNGIPCDFYDVGQGKMLCRYERGKLVKKEFYRLAGRMSYFEKDEIEFIEKRRIRRRIYDWDDIKSNKVLFEATYKKRGKKYVIEKWSLFLDGKERRGN